jgi:chromosome segregation ATPase
MASNKFNKVVDYVIGNDTERARALLHKYIVETSRKLYEDIEDDESTSKIFDDVEADETAASDEASEPSEELGGDEADDLENDVFDDTDNTDDTDLEDTNNSEDELNPDIDDRVADLESEFDKLQAKLSGIEQDIETADEDLENSEDDLENSEEDLENSDEDLENSDEDLENSEDDLENSEEDLENSEEDLENSDEDLENSDEKDEAVDESVIREYVEKVTKGLSLSTEAEGINTKSPVAGKNEIVKGVNAHNIARGSSEKGRPAPEAKPMMTGEIQNRPGGKAGKALRPVNKVKNTEIKGTNTQSIEA